MEGKSLKIKKFRWCIAGLMIAIVMSSCGKSADSVSNKNEEVIEEKQPAEQKEETVSEVQNIDYRDIKSISLLDLYDFDDDSSLENGMYTQVSDEASEKEFLSFFYTDDSQYQVIEDAGVKVFVGTVDDKNVFVSLVGNGKSEYPKEAYGFKYSPSDAVKEAKYIPYQEGIEVLDGVKSIDGQEYQYIDEIKPLLDYQEKEYNIREDGKLVKVEYSSDSEEYGTYNSSGTLYYDSQERPFYKSYYVTSGSKYMFYLYNEDGDLMQIIDFGGMAYKELEENPNIEIGVDFKTYIFE